MLMSVPPESIYCPLRKIWVAALPEELVRQSLIEKMVKQLGYPLGIMGAEITLSQLPHLKMQPSIPKRRADLIVFGKNLHPRHPLFPLLLIECKAIPLTPKVLRQVVGYNQFVGARFIGVVNQTSSFFGWFDPRRNDLSFQEGFPSYQFLTHYIQEKRSGYFP